MTPLKTIVLILILVMLPAVSASASDEDRRRLDAIENIREALDLDPEGVARLLGSTPVENLDLESLEALGEKAAQFIQQSAEEDRRAQMAEMRRLRELREQQEERRRLRELQELQNIRRP